MQPRPSATNKDAPQYKLVSVDLTNPPEQHVFHNVIPENKGAHIKDATAVNPVNRNNFIVTYKHNVCSSAHLHII